MDVNHYGANITKCKEAPLFCKSSCVTVFGMKLDVYNRKYEKCKRMCQKYDFSVMHIHAIR